MEILRSREIPMALRMAKILAFAKVKMAVVSTLFIRDLAAGSFVENEGTLSFTELVTICCRFSRELEHSDLNLNKIEELLSQDTIFSLENLLKILFA